MKKLLGTITLTLIPFVFSYGQQREPIVVSPLIGEKIERVEEEFFRLFPRFQGFQEGIFYLNSDSTLDAYISYEYNDLILDTLIKDYLSYKKLQRYINYQATDDRNEARKIKRGKYANIFTKRDSLFIGELLSVNNSSIIFLNLNEESYFKDNMPPFNVGKFQHTYIDKLVVIDKTNIANYLYPAVLGLGLGLTTALLTKEEEKDKPDLSSGINLDFSPFLYGMLGTAIGYLAGYVLSEIFPIISNSETNYEPPFSKLEITGLKQVTRYK